MPEHSPPITELEWRLLGAEAAWLTGYRVEHDLPGLATDALVAGLDSPTLRVLAGERPDGFASDLGELLADALRELGRPVPEPADAWRARVAFRCWEIAVGRVGGEAAAAHVEAIGYNDPAMPDDAEDVVFEFSGFDDTLWGIRDGWSPVSLPALRAEVAARAAEVVERYREGMLLAEPLPREPEPPRRRSWWRRRISRT